MNWSFRRIARAALVGACLACLGSAPTADASPIASVDYVESSLGGGLFQYDYTVTSLSDPADAGEDIFWLTLSFASSISLVSDDTPVDWAVNGGAGFIDAFSLAIGAAPVGADIGPGQHLGGFSFVLDGQIGSSAFQALFANPADPFNPTVFDGLTTQAPTAPGEVPEPASLLLVGSGVGSFILGRRRRTNRQ
jgi:hypothetical protein